MIDILRDIEDVAELTSRYPSDTVMAAASVRGIPVTIFKAFERDDINTILPIMILKGVEYGGCSSEDDYMEHYEMAKKRVAELYGDSKTLLEPIIYSNVELWRLFNIRYAGYLQRIYGVQNTCLTCKAFFTIVQIHLATMFNKRIILEQKFNGKKTLFIEDKLRSRFEYSDSFLFNKYGIEVIRPLNGYKTLEDIRALIGESWSFMEKEPACLFRRSWKDLDDDKTRSKADVPNTIIEEYIRPVSDMLIQQLNADFKSSGDVINKLINDYFISIRG